MNAPMKTRSTLAGQLLDQVLEARVADERDLVRLPLRTTPPTTWGMMLARFAFMTRARRARVGPLGDQVDDADAQPALRRPDRVVASDRVLAGKRLGAELTCDRSSLSRSSLLGADAPGFPSSSVRVLATTPIEGMFPRRARGFPVTTFHHDVGATSGRRRLTGGGFRAGAGSRAPASGARPVGWPGVSPPRARLGRILISDRSDRT